MTQKPHDDASEGRDDDLWEANEQRIIDSWRAMGYVIPVPQDEQRARFDTAADIYRKAMMISPGVTRG